MIDENQFSQMMKESLSDLKGKVLFVTGPGRSGAVAAVYASYYLGAAYVPYGHQVPNKGTMLVVDTIEQSGATLRKAAKRYPGCIVRSICGKKDTREHFWFEFQNS